MTLPLSGVPESTREQREAAADRLRDALVENEGHAYGHPASHLVVMTADVRDALSLLDEARNDSERLDFLGGEFASVDASAGWGSERDPLKWRRILETGTLREAIDAARGTSPTPSGGTMEGK